MCVRVSRKERQGNRTLCDLDVSGRREPGLQRVTFGNGKSCCELETENRRVRSREREGRKRAFEIDNWRVLRKE